MPFTPPARSFASHTWDAGIAINLRAACAAVSAMRRAGWGRIIESVSAPMVVAAPPDLAAFAARLRQAGLTRVAARSAAIPVQRGLPAGATMAGAGLPIAGAWVAG